MRAGLVWFTAIIMRLARMLFNSFEYIIFYAAFFLAFFAVGTLRVQVLLICAASLYGPDIPLYFHTYLVIIGNSI